MAGNGRNPKDIFWRLVRPARQRIVRSTRCPAINRVDWGDFRSSVPISNDWGFDRGTPVDRYYIQQFLADNRNDIQGRVLEIADDTYTREFGGDRVTKSDVIHPTTGNPKATIIADLVDAPDLSNELFDCIICTQTLQLIFDFNSAVATLFRLLRERGVLLLTVPGISQICRKDSAISGDYWRFTELSLRQALCKSFSDTDCDVKSFGSVLTSIAFLQGIAAEELEDIELGTHDPQYQLMLTARAIKST